MNLLLTSSGVVPEIRDVFLSVLPERPRVAFITTAGFGESKEPVWMEGDRKRLIDCGVRDIVDLDLKDKSEVEVGKAMEDRNVVYVNGGNTFYLLYWVKKSGFDKVLKNFKGLYVGVSAGSYIACPAIVMASWKHQDRNRVGITDFTALNLVPFLITAHFEEAYRSIVDKASKSTGYPIVAITDEQAVLVDNGVRVIGVGKKEFWNGFKES